MPNTHANSSLEHHAPLAPQLVRFKLSDVDLSDPSALMFLLSRGRLAGQTALETLSPNGSAVDDASPNVDAADAPMDASANGGTPRSGSGGSSSRHVMRRKNKGGNDKTNADADGADANGEEGSHKKKKPRVKVVATPPVAVRLFPRDIGSNPVDEAGSVKMQQGLEPMRDSSALFAGKKYFELYQAFDTDGYILLKGLLSRTDLTALRYAVQGILEESGAAAEDGQCLKKAGWTVDTSSAVSIAGSADYTTEFGKEGNIWAPIARSEVVARVENSAELAQAMRALAVGRHIAERVSSEPMKFAPSYTWLRVKAPGECTSEHSDVFFFRNYTDMFLTPDGTDDRCGKCKSSERPRSMLLCDECDKCYHMDCLDPPLEEVPRDNWYCEHCAERPILISCWAPLADVDIDGGGLAVLKGSQNLPNFLQPSSAYPQIPSSYQKHGRGLTWSTGTYEQGDVVIFNSKAVHCTSKNYHSFHRLSIDMRWVLTPKNRSNFGQTPQSKFILDNAQSCK